MSKRKKSLSEYCQGCLSNDRPLVSIDCYYYIFLKLMDGEFDNIDAQMEVPRMCWECRAVLRNSERLMKNVKKAHDFLNNEMVKIESLSNLQKITNNYYIHDIHEDALDETDVKPHDIPEKIEIDLKKEENTTDDEKFETDCYDDIKEESYEMDHNIKEEPKTEEDIKVKKHDKKMKSNKFTSLKSKFKVLCLTEEELDTRKLTKKVTIGEKEMYQWMEKDKYARNYRSMKYKCELCVTGHSTLEIYNRHIAKFHLETSGDYECDFCKRRFKIKKDIVNHVRAHYIKYVCLLCNYENYRDWKMKSHFKTHKRAVACLTCGLTFGKLCDFYKHYRDYHAHVICDYCGKKWTKKFRLIRHIKLRHTEHICRVCGRSYMSLDALDLHVNMNHVIQRNEESYCVECNIQFDNISRYNVHLKTSVKHRNYRGIPCPACNKVYGKKCTMNNHYRLVHLKETPYYCEKCSRYFLNGYRLRLHTARIHDKISPVKDKMCPYCDRSFSTNRILSNHIRTHTGERPYMCEICPAKFAQKTPLKVHQRAVHKMQV